MNNFSCILHILRKIINNFFVSLNNNMNCYKFFLSLFLFFCTILLLIWKLILPLKWNVFDPISADFVHAKNDVRSRFWTLKLSPPKFRKIVVDCDWNGKIFRNVQTLRLSWENRWVLLKKKHWISWKPAKVQICYKMGITWYYLLKMFFFSFENLMKFFLKNYPFIFLKVIYNKVGGRKISRC